MSEPEVKLVFDIKTGEIKINAKNFKGSACEEATKFLKGLGNVKSFNKKSAWYEMNLNTFGTIRSDLCG